MAFGGTTGEGSEMDEPAFPSYRETQLKHYHPGLDKRVLLQVGSDLIITFVRNSGWLTLLLTLKPFSFSFVTHFAFSVSAAATELCI